jgi:FKBP-type peptidyl-prolyl cis-trans isomerase FkpA
MKKTTFILLGLALVLMTGCDSNGFRRTRSGLMYKIISEKDAQPVKRGDWLKVNHKQTVRDSVLQESYNSVPAYVPVDSVPATYQVAEVFPLLHKGDSAVIVLFADSIYKKQGGLPPFLSRKDKVILTLKVVDVFTSDSAKSADEMATWNAFQQKQQEEFESRKEPTIREIEEYLASNNIKYVKTPKGTYIVIKEEGSGPHADSGKIAEVLYRGTMFKTGKQFDSNMDGSRPPFSVRVGLRTVIEGWEDALPYFGKGGKGTLYIPYWLAYGSQPQPDNTPYANLVFDIEVVDVKDANADQQKGGARTPDAGQQKAAQQAPENK